jgi:type I restriction enzyme S subunit
MDDIGDIVTGNTPSKDIKCYYGGNIPFYKPTDLDQGLLTCKSSDTLTIAGFEQSRKLPKDSILVTCIGATIGKTGRITVEGSCNQQINAIIPNGCILSEFLYYICITNYFQTEIKENASATTLPILNKAKFAELYIPLPPIAEQSRILNAILKWENTIQNIERDTECLTRNINIAKSKILALAISGKLVPQSTSDEPAIEALRRINPSFQPCDNPQYEQLPKSWAVAKIGDVYTINPRNSADDKTEAGFIPMTNIHDGYNNSFLFELRNWGAIKTGFTHFRNGDIVVAKISPCLENRKSAVISGLPNGIGAGTTELHVFRQKNINPLYGLMFFKTNNFIQSCTGSFNGAVGQQRVSTKVITELEIPIPPIAEQQRIVDKVNELFTILDSIQNSLDAN